MKIKLINLRSILTKRLLLLFMKTFIFLFCTSVFSFNTSLIYAQEKVKIDADKFVTVDEVFSIIQKQTKYSFIYPQDLFENLPKVELKKGTIQVGSLLKKSISTSDFSLILSENNTIIIKENAAIQEIVVTGKVTDQDGLPMAGVTVLIKGVSKGVITDFNGSYSIAVSAKENVLIFSYLGYGKQEIIVGDKKIINVTLREESSKLDEIVLNAGYYKTTDKKKTGSISKINSVQIQEQPVSDPIQALQGRVPGLLITQTSGAIPGGAFANVQIRGNNSIGAGSNPLYIVDGIPYPSIPVSGAVAGQEEQFYAATSSNPLNTINPADIESVEILKDADATSIYGSRGTNGVILITTKKGKSGKTSLDVDYYTGFGQIAQRLDLMSTEQYLQMRRDAFQTEGLTPNIDNAPDLLVWDQTIDNNIQDKLFGGVSVIQNANASLSWGNDTTNYIFSTGFRGEGNVYNIDDLTFKKFTGRMAVNHTMFNDKITLSANIMFSSSSNFSSPGLFLANFLTSPNYQLFNDDGSFYWNPDPFSYDNPLARLENRIDKKDQNLTANFALTAKLSKHIDFKTNFGYTDINSDINEQTKRSSLHPIFAGFSGASFATASDKTFIVEPQLSYIRNFGKLNFNLLFGGTYQNSQSAKLNLFSSGQASDDLLGNIGNGTTITVTGNENFDYKYASFFTRLGLEWDGKYILNGSFRRDASSRFGASRRIGNFASIAAAWIFSEEDFLKESNFISFGKIRTSYGTTGNDQIPDYGYLDTYTNLQFPYIVSPLIAQRIANPFYSWETNKKFEVGLELGFIQDRVRLTTNYFLNRSSNQLVGQPLPSQSGFSSYQANLPALVENTGLEFDLTTTNIKNENFSWTTSFNLTMPRNELVSFPGLESSTFANTLTVGKPLDHFRGFIFLGVDPDNGDPILQDIDGDGRISRPNDFVFIGKMYPDFYGGMYNEFQYKRVRLSFFLQFRKGFHANSPGSFEVFGQQINQLAEVSGNYWMNPGDNARYPRLAIEDISALGNYRSSSDFRSETSFLRLSNVNVSFDLKNPTFERWGIQKSNLVLTGQNLFLISNYDGFDPETGRSGLPPLQIISLGFNFSL